MRQKKSETPKAAPEAVVLVSVAETPPELTHRAFGTAQSKTGEWRVVELGYNLQTGTASIVREHPADGGRDHVREMFRILVARSEIL